MPRRPTFNTYRVDGDVTHIDLMGKDGQVRAVALIDTVDLPLLIGLGRRWVTFNTTPKNRNGVDKFYVATKIDRRTIYLHRLLVGHPENKVIDHINGDPLDNRRKNIRVVDQAENSKNRNGPTQFNKLGVRNVIRVTAFARRPFIVRLKENGGTKYRTACTTLNIAAITAEMARLQYWGKEAV